MMAFAASAEVTDDGLAASAEVTDDGLAASAEVTDDGLAELGALQLANVLFAESAGAGAARRLVRLLQHQAGEIVRDGPRDDGALHAADDQVGRLVPAHVPK